MLLRIFTQNYLNKSFNISHFASWYDTVMSGPCPAVKVKKKYSRKLATSPNVWCL